MAKIHHTLEAKASVAAGAATFVGDLTSAEVQVGGTFSATVKVQGSVDKVTWSDIASVTSASLTSVTAGYQWVRLNTTVYSSGTPTAFVGGSAVAPGDVKATNVKLFMAAAANGAAAAGGTTGSTTYTYKVVAYNADGQPGAATGNITDTAGNATLSAL